MKRLYAPAVLLWTAGAASAQVRVPRLPSSIGAPPVSLSRTLAAPSVSVPGPEALVLGVPGPGVTPAQIEAVKALALETGLPWVIHGSRQTGVSHHTGKPYHQNTDLDTAVVGKPADLLSIERDIWDGRVPRMSHGPMMAVPSVEEAVGKGHLVVAPPRARLSGERGVLQRHARPWRTENQLTKLAAAPRSDGEAFKFAIIGDAEPGRFWFSRALYNVPGVFWRLLHRADRSKPDFILQLGDMVSRGTVPRFWAFIKGMISSGIRTPFLTVIGNHDRHKPHGVTNDDVYRLTFGETNYVFDRGGRRFVVVDSSAGRILPEQLAWLEGVLKNGPPAVVFTHIPPAPLGEWTDWGKFKGAGGFKPGAVEFMALMSKYKVSRVYMGHVHGLGKLERGGVTYVLTGGGGSPLYPGPVKQKLHHWLSVSVGPDGLAETVHAADGTSFPLN